MDVQGVVGQAIAQGDQGFDRVGKSVGAGCERGKEAAFPRLSTRFRACRSPTRNGRSWAAGVSGPPALGASVRKGVGIGFAEERNEDVVISGAFGLGAGEAAYRLGQPAGPFTIAFLSI
jgi:hypothetical protein